MNHFHRQIRLAAAPADVYRALTTQQGLRGWWTETCDIATQLGGRSTFRFGRHHKVMQLERLEPNREVGWHCVEAHIDVARLRRKDEWVGTRPVFHLAPDGAGGTVLDFEHIGLTPDIECYSMCHDGWDQYLGSLQRLVETGQGSPFVPQVAAVA